MRQAHHMTLVIKEIGLALHGHHAVLGHGAVRHEVEKVSSFAIPSAFLGVGRAVEVIPITPASLIPLGGLFEVAVLKAYIVRGVLAPEIADFLGLGNVVGYLAVGEIRNCGSSVELCLMHRIDEARLGVFGVVQHILRRHPRRELRGHHQGARRQGVKVAAGVRAHQTMMSQLEQVYLAQLFGQAVLIAIQVSNVSCQKGLMGVGLDQDAQRELIGIVLGMGEVVSIVIINRDIHRTQLELGIAHIGSLRAFRGGGNDLRLGGACRLIFLHGLRSRLRSHGLYHLLGVQRHRVARYRSEDALLGNRRLRGCRSFWGIGGLLRRIRGIGLCRFLGTCRVLRICRISGSGIFWSLFQTAGIHGGRGVEALDERGAICQRCGYRAVVDILVVPETGGLEDIGILIGQEVDALRLELLDNLVGAANVVAVGMGAHKELEVLAGDTHGLHVGKELVGHPSPTGDALAQRIARIFARRVVVVLSGIHQTKATVALQQDGVGEAKGEHVDSRRGVDRRRDGWRCPHSRRHRKQQQSPPYHRQCHQNALAGRAHHPSNSFTPGAPRVYLGNRVMGSSKPRYFFALNT